MSPDYAAARRGFSESQGGRDGLIRYDDRFPGDPLTSMRRAEPAPEFLQPVLFAVGVIVIAVGLFMLIPAAVDLAIDHPDWTVFAASSAVSVFVGGSIVLATRGHSAALNIRQAFLVTTLSWLAAAAAGMTPFLFAQNALSVADAAFESMSGLTTTGSTVLVGLDGLPPGILLWRSILQWLGGIGIVVTAVALLPMLRVGGMQIFRTESSDRSEKLFPRASQVASAIAVTYLTLTVLCAVLYRLTGFTWFDAVNHAMTTISTGGFSTHDTSFGFFDDPLAETVAILFMIAGAMPLLFWIRHSSHRRGDIQDAQVPAFLGAVAFFAVALALWRWIESDADFLTALRHSAFNVVSVVTTTGYATTDYGAWGGFADGFFLILLFVGGCTGSTSGSLKIFRWQVLWSFLKAQMRKMISPHRVADPIYAGTKLPESAVTSVLALLAIYVVTLGVLTFLFSLTGAEFVTSVSAVATAITNVGPGLGPVVGPAGNFSSLSDAGKWILTVAMLLGRLEIFTVIVLLSGSFWRH